MKHIAIFNAVVTSAGTHELACLRARCGRFLIKSYQIDVTALTVAGVAISSDGGIAPGSAQAGSGANILFVGEFNGFADVTITGTFDGSGDPVSMFVEVYEL